MKNWEHTRIKEDEIIKYMDNKKDFIPEEDIKKQLNDGKNKVFDRIRFEEILNKSLSIKTLDPDEVAFLLNINDKDAVREMKKIAAQIKQKVYDKRIVTFAPLYTGNICVNNCAYCGFRKGNAEAVRKVLTRDQIRKETEVLAGKIGHKRLIVVYGEHPTTDIDYMVDTIRAIYSVKVKTKHGESGIRRVNVNAPPLQIDSLKKLKQVGIGTYQVFQETYNKNMYGKLHPKGTIKGHYLWRLYSMHRAFEAGIDDVGIGALFGLYDWKFEVMGLVYHALELEKRFNVGPHTISFPRLEPAFNTPFSEQSPHIVSDEDFERLILVLRLAIPHAGMILTCRENAQLKKKIIPLGITQIDASSKIGIGAYHDDHKNIKGANQQFILGDTRSLDEIIKELAQIGYITSFCTAGYRCGRTGECIMELLKSGKEGVFCKLNAVLTYREWIDDFASEETKQAAEKLIKKEIDEIKKELPTVYEQFMDYYRKTQTGKRDLYF
ncbi:[FeFe] hydrogenase H-cluster radical SAM maturase HydG [bacterium]